MLCDTYTVIYLFVQPCTVCIIVELSIEDSSKYGHSIINLFTKDITYDPSIIPTIRSKAETSVQRTCRSAEFKSLPNCPLFGGFPVVHVHLLYHCIAK